MLYVCATVPKPQYHFFPPSPPIRLVGHERALCSLAVWLSAVARQPEEDRNVWRVIPFISISHTHTRYVWCTACLRGSFYPQRHLKSGILFCPKPGTKLKYTPDCIYIYPPERWSGVWGGGTPGLLRSSRVYVQWEAVLNSTRQPDSNNKRNTSPGEKKNIQGEPVTAFSNSQIINAEKYEIGCGKVANTHSASLCLSWDESESSAWEVEVSWAGQTLAHIPLQPSPDLAISQPAPIPREPYTHQSLWKRIGVYKEKFTSSRLHHARRGG